MPTVAEICQHLKTIAPLDLAGDWDNVGLLLGDESAQVSKLMTCLTISPESAREAIDNGAQMIVTHHPIFFRPIQKLTTSNRSTRFLYDLARAGVAVYSPHSAWDNTRGGINEKIAAKLGLEQVEPLRKTIGKREVKIVVFTPENDLQNVSEALFQAGAGRIGDYSECSYRVTGRGTFLGSEQTNPTIGEKGKREEVTELRLEIICPEEKLPKALAAMISSHSYEEPAYDVYPLRPKSSSLGEGRIGSLPSPLQLDNLARNLGTSLKAPIMQVVGDGSREVKKVAIACGAAGEFLRDAIAAKADVFITGEMRFHDYLSAQAQKIALLLPGHFASERFAMEELALQLQTIWPEVTFWASAKETDPVRLVR